MDSGLEKAQCLFDRSTKRGINNGTVEGEWQMQCSDLWLVLWQGGMRKEFRQRQRVGCTTCLTMVKKD